MRGGGGYLLNIAGPTLDGVRGAGCKVSWGVVLGVGHHDSTRVIEEGASRGPAMAEVPAMVVAIVVCGAGLGHGATWVSGGLGCRSLGLVRRLVGRLVAGTISVAIAVCIGGLIVCGRNRGLLWREGRDSTCKSVGRVLGWELRWLRWGWRWLVVLVWEVWLHVACKWVDGV